MIPKIIHYCWFGGNEMPPLVQKCIKSWKKYLPDYEFKLWNEEIFDVNCNAWCQQAYQAKKYAFVADYCRLIALYEEGGIYLDTDIQLCHSLTPFLNQNAFMGFEDGKVLSMGVIGMTAKFAILKESLDYYENTTFSNEIIKESIANVVIFTQLLEEKYGLIRNNTEQWIAGIHIYPRTYFNPMDFFGNWDKSKNTVAIHLYMGSWLPKSEQRKVHFRKTILFKIIKGIWNHLKSIKALAYIRRYLKKKNII